MLEATGNQIVQLEAHVGGTAAQRRMLGFCLPVRGICTEKTRETDGCETPQNLEACLTLESDSGEFLCAAGAFVFTALAVIGLLIPRLRVG